MPTCCKDATGRVALVALLALIVGDGCSGRSPPAVKARAEPRSDSARRSLKCKDCNVVFVSFDALQAAHVGCLGNPRNVTPTLDAMAHDGFLFTNAFSVSSWTVPASMSWFTGVYPSEHRITNKFALYQPPFQKMANLRELCPDLLTLADILKQNGYATAGFTGNAGVSGGFGYEQGFDVYVHEKGKFGSMDQSIPEALKWLQANRDRKFFLFLHGYDIHGQCTPATGFDNRFVDRDYGGRYTGSEREQEVLREEGLDKGQLTLDDSDVRFWSAIYDEKIQRTDEKFKRFLGAFEKLGLMENTLFVLTSDHGTEIYEHRRFDHGFTLYDEQIHVPLIFKIPGVKGGKQISTRVSSIDVMQTVLDLVDADIPRRAREQMRGASLARAMSGESTSRDVISETDYRLYTFKRSIITPDGWKLIRTMETRSRELYDLEADPGETTNLIDTEAARASGIEQRLLMHFRSIGHDLTARRWEVGFNPVYAFPDRGGSRKD